MQLRNSEEVRQVCEAYKEELTTSHNKNSTTFMSIKKKKKENQMRKTMVSLIFRVLGFVKDGTNLLNRRVFWIMHSVRVRYLEL